MRENGTICPFGVVSLLEATSAIVLDAVRMWFGCGLDAVRMWFGCGSDVVRTCFRMWLGRVFGSGADGLAEVKGKWFSSMFPLS